MKPLNLARMKKTAAAALLLLMLAPMPAMAAELKLNAVSQVDEVLELLEQNHVSAPSKDSLSNAAIKSMVESLKDPYTTYFTPEEWKQFNSSLEQNYVGIGVRVSEVEDGILIVEVFSGTSAEAAGIKRGDIITGVEGKSAAGQKLDDVVGTILGPEGTSVNLTVKRGADKFDVKATRKQVKIPVVTSRMFDGGAGYIKVTTFSSDSDELFASHMEALKKNGLKTLIVDLRDNPGGLLESALNMAKLFVKEGTLIHTKDRDSVDDPVLIKGGTTQSFPVIVLINENSASASEVLTGALQDYNVVSKVIGVKSFGKGSVQEVYPLTNGGSLKVTIEEYLTPKMRKVNKVGLQPDIEVEGELTQLITGLRAAGVTSFDIQRTKLNVTVNGAEMTDSFASVSDDGKLYVPARLLAAIVGADVSWDEASSSVVIQAGGSKAVYPIDDASSISMRNGTSYVNVAKFAESFPQLKWSNKDDILNLSTKGN